MVNISLPVILFYCIHSDYEEILKSVGWPMIGNTLKAPPVHNSQHNESLEILFMSLLTIQLPYPLSSNMFNLKLLTGNTVEDILFISHMITNRLYL